jgi:hypothetical protein
LKIRASLGFAPYMEAMNANDNDAALRKNEDENGKQGTSDPLYTVPRR